MRFRAGPVLLALGCALYPSGACGPVAAPPPAPEPVNACPAHPCAAYVDSAGPPTCQDGICQSGGALFTFFFLVSLPESSSFGPGLTVPIMFPAATPSCTSATALDEQCLPACPTSSPSAPNADCVWMPQVLRPFGALVVEGQIVQSANAQSYVGNGGAPTSLPIHVQYRPLWPPDGSSALHVEAASIGLPLLPTDADLDLVTLGYPGPQGTLATQWHARLGPGFYEPDVVPDNAAFPVLRRLCQGCAPWVAADDDTFLTEQPNVDLAGESVGGAAPPESLQVTSENGWISLEGFSVYLRDRTTLRRVSSVTTSPDQAAPCSLTAPIVSCASGFTCTSKGTCIPLLLTLGGEWPTNGIPSDLDVVIAPPAGAPIPYLADAVVTSSLSKEEFPQLPAPVTVSGTVVAGQDVIGVPASLVIDSTSGVAGGGITTTTTNNPRQPFLHYSTAVQTDDAGNYSVTLPPGTYDVSITPALGSNLGITTLTLDVASPLANLPPVAQGKDLVLSPLGTMVGKAAVADGRPLEGATVQALPAASLAPTVDPRRWPRAASATTDATGAFALSLDPGTYDVVVQPADGTGLPWVTLSQQTVFGGELTNLQFGQPIVVPAPLVRDLVLHDPNDDNPIVHAIVRAFAATASSTNPTPGAPAPVIEIGRWMTDTSGHLTMLLAPPK